MSPDSIIVLVVLLAAVVLFVSEKLRIDVIALLIMTSLIVTGVLEAEEAIAGLSNRATVTVAAMMVLSGGLTRTGALDAVAKALGRLASRSVSRTLAVVQIPVAAISAFINNTAAVAIFLPIVMRIARGTGIAPSKLLIPLSFAGILGGTCTLIGTSTNLLIDAVAVEHGLPAIGMFELGSLGLILLAVGLVYMMTLGVRLLPERKADDDLTRDFDLADYVLEIEIREDSQAIEKTLEEADFRKELDLDVLDVVRGKARRSLPPEDTVLRAGDILRVRCGAEDVAELRRRPGVELRPINDLRDEDLEGDAVLAEAVVPASSPVIGETVKDVRILEAWSAALLAIRHRGRVEHERLARRPLRAGDVLLLEVPRDRLETARGTPSLVLVPRQEVAGPRRRALLAAILVGGVVAVAAQGILPIVSAAIAGCVLMILTGCLTMRQAYESIDWQVVFLLAGALSLGTAMETTGTARTISELLVGFVGELGPRALVSAFFLLTAALTAAISNNATAVVLAPIAISTAEGMGLDPRPFLMAIVFGASASFLTPVGYQTNTLVYGPGKYRFLDFVRVGGPLVVLFWILATVLIPRIWPL